MEFEDKHRKIYHQFIHEYNKCYSTWKTFLDSKDLGITKDVRYSAVTSMFRRYIITDKKKWALTKIKYGF